MPARSERRLVRTHRHHRFQATAPTASRRRSHSGRGANRMIAQLLGATARAYMEPDKRIEELEREVQTLQGMVRQLLHASGAPPVDEDGAPVAERRKTPVHLREPALLRTLIGRIDNVLTGGAGDSMETHVGAVWLSRLAILAILTAFALAGRATLISPELGPAEKVAIGYLASVALAMLGFCIRKSYDVYADTLLGCGLAGLYFTTYAACFLDGARIAAFAAPWIAFPAASAALILVAAVAQGLRSPTVAGIGLVMAYYSIAVSSRGADGFAEQVYALFTCAEIAVAALLVFVLNGWRMLSWLAVLGTHLTYYVFFIRAPHETAIGDTSFFWLASGFLTLSFIVLAIGLVIDTRQRGPATRHNGTIAAVHSIFFIGLVWFSVPEAYNAQLWLFRAAWCGLFALFAALAWVVVGPRCYLFQIFAGLTGILAGFVCEACLAAHHLPVALALAGVVFGIACSRTGLPVFRALGLTALVASGASMGATMNEAGVIRLAGISLAPDEFAALGVVLACVAAAWVYERLCLRHDAEAARHPGALLFARSILSQDSAVMSMLNAAAAAFVLLIVTISERGESVRLPFLLAAEGLSLAAVGMVLRVRPVEAASAILIAAAHVTFYVFLALPIPGFRDQYAYVPLTLSLAVFTFGAVYLWERYLRRLGGPGFERHIAGVLPYAAATLLLVYLAEDALPPVAVPAAQALLGASIMIAGAHTRHYSPVAAGLLALGLGVAHFLMEVSAPVFDVTGSAAFPPMLALVLAALAAGERALNRILAGHPEIAPLLNGLRALLVAALVATGILAIGAWLHERTVVFGLLALAVCLMGAGAGLRESRYRWASLFLLGAVAVRAFLVVRGLAPVWQVLSFASVGAVMLAVSFAYARARKRARHDAMRRLLKPGAER